MSFGNKYIPPQEYKTEDAIIETEAIIRNVQEQNKEPARAELAAAIMNFKSNQSRKFSTEMKKFEKNIKDVKTFLIRNNMFLCKADKTQDIVLLTRQQFEDRANACIQELNLKQASEKTFNKWKKDFLKFSKYDQLTNLLGCFKPPDNIKIPKLFFQTKTHKDGNPFRPLVAAWSSPSYNFEKKLAKILYQQISTYEHKITSSIQFISKLKTCNVQQDPNKIVILDVVKMFSNIPVLQAHMWAVNILRERLSLNNSIVKQLYEILKSLRENYCFTHDGCIYVQKDSLPMGSPMSSILSEIFMEKIEENILLNDNYGDVPIFYKRYADDIFLIWDKDFDILQSKLQRITETYPTLQFEIKRQNSFPIKYLDIHINVINNKWEFSVANKITTQLIPFDAYTTWNYKMSGIKAHIYRAIRICNTTNGFIKEYNNIIKLAAEFGYRKELIDKITKNCCERERERINKDIDIIKNNAQTNNNNDQENKSIHTSITYSPIAQKQKILAKRYGVNVAIKAQPHVINRLRKDSIYKNFEQGPGVYEIPLLSPNDPPKKYIGSTSRSLKERLNEHKRLNFLRKHNIAHQKTNLTEFLSENTQYEPKWDQAKLIRKKGNDKNNDMRMREALLIKTNTDAINKELPVYISEVWNNLLRRP